MVVPHWIVEEEPRVACSPRVAHTRVLLDANVRDAKQLEPRTQAQAGLAAPDDEHKRVRRLAAELSRQRCGALLVPIAPARPRLRDLAYRLHRVAQRSALARGKRARLQCAQAGGQRERLAVRIEPHVGLAMACGRLECEPGFGQLTFGARAAVYAPAVWRGCRYCHCKCFADLVPPLERLYAPRKGHHVPPKRPLSREALVCSAIRKAAGKSSEPLRHPSGCCRRCRAESSLACPGACGQSHVPHNLDDLVPCRRGGRHATIQQPKDKEPSRLGNC